MTANNILVFQKQIKKKKRDFFTNGNFANQRYQELNKRKKEIQIMPSLQ